MCFNYVELFAHDSWYVECFVLRLMIFTKLNNLYLQISISFDYVERYALLLNDFNAWMKLPSRKYPPEDCFVTFSPWKI